MMFRFVQRPQTIPNLAKSHSGLFRRKIVFNCIILRVTSPLLLIGLTMSVGGCLYISTKGQGKTVKLFGIHNIM